MATIYCVTGAAGHLGSAVVELLKTQGAVVRALVLPGEAHVPGGSGVTVYEGDVRCKESLLPFFAHTPEDALVVFHCAGIVSIASHFSQAVYDVNVTGTRNVAEAARESGVQKFVHVSSVHAIPERPKGECITEVSDFSPETVHGLYAKTKAEATAAVLRMAEQGLPACVVHPSGICGPGDNGRGHITALVEDFCTRHLTAAVRGGYDFVDVRDVAAGMLAAAEKAPVGECYILSGAYYDVFSMLEMLHDITGVRRVRTCLPLWFIRPMAPFAEQYYKMKKRPPLYTEYSLYTLQSNAAFSHEKAARALGYAPRPMRQTLTDTVAWLRAQGRI